MVRSGQQQLKTQPAQMCHISRIQAQGMAGQGKKVGPESSRRRQIQPARQFQALFVIRPDRIAHLVRRVAFVTDARAGRLR